MFQVQRILFATDFSPCAEAACRYAFALAYAARAELHFLHVCTETHHADAPGELPGSLHADVDVFIRNQLNAIAAEARVLPGPVKCHIRYAAKASMEICRFVQEEKIGLVVMGTRGLGGIRRLLHGSTTQRVARMLQVPLLSVHQDAAPGTVLGDPATYPAFTKLLVAVDFSACSLAALNLAESLAGYFQSGILLVHVLEDIVPVGFDLGMVLPFPEITGNRLESASRRLQALQPADLLSAGRIRTMVVPGISSLEILDLSQSEKAEAVCMGLHGRDVSEENFTGSVADKVMRNAECPVFTVSCPQQTG